MRKYLLIIIFSFAIAFSYAQTSLKEPISSTKPGVYQLQQIDRKYGMFITFGMNTFHDEEWTDGSKSASSYKPTELLNITGKYTKVVELWLVGSWEKKNTRWPLNEIYETVKQEEPQCQIGVNWSIGSPENPDSLIHPSDQKAGYPIRYFPSDFRLGDPYLPAIPDPKLFTHSNKEYYMPWESTICISQRWFYNTHDTIYKTPEDLLKLYKAATAQNNILILNLPPSREGKLRKKDIQLVSDLRKLIDK